MSDLILRESVDNMGMSLKADLLSLFEDDRKMKNIRFSEVFHLIDSNKQLLNEHIAQQFESLKALTRAFVNKEVAERASGDNSILSQVNKRLDGFDAVFDAKIKGDIREMTRQLQENADGMVKALEDAQAAKEKIENDLRLSLEPKFKELEDRL